MSKKDWIEGTARVVLLLGALAAIIYLAILMDSEAAQTALVGIVSAAGIFFLTRRSRDEPPGQ